MEGLNRVTLFGNLGQDPELRFIQSGNAVLKMRMATSERWVDKSGEKQERTEWHTIVLWGKRAEALGKFLKKGDRLLIEGRLQTREWEDKQGQKRWTTEVVATNVVLGGGGKGERRSDSGSSSADEAPPDDGYGGGADDLPF